MLSLPSNRVFRITYPSVFNVHPGKQDSSLTSHNEPQLWKCRDGLAAMELLAAMPREKCYETSLMLYPSDEQRSWEEFPRFSPGDWLLLTTRPPISDAPQHRKSIPASKSVLEDVVFSPLKEYLHTCSRKRLELEEKSMKLLLPDLRNSWSNVEFAEHSKMPEKQADEHFLQIAKPVKGRILEMRLKSGKGEPSSRTSRDMLAPKSGRSAQSACSFESTTSRYPTPPVSRS